MVVKFERVKEGYYFWLFKGIVEIIMAFVILWKVIIVDSGITSSLLVSFFYLIFVLLLIAFGVSDLRYFIKLKDERYSFQEQEVNK